MSKFLINERVLAKVGADAVNKTLKKIWRGFTFTVSELEFDECPTEANAIVLGDVALPELSAGLSTLFPLPSATPVGVMTRSLCPSARSVDPLFRNNASHSALP